MTPDDQLRQAERVANTEPEDECHHRFVKYGEAPDGTGFYRCAKCGKESE